MSDKSPPFVTNYQQTADGRYTFEIFLGSIFPMKKEALALRNWCSDNLEGDDWFCMTEVRSPYAHITCCADDAVKIKLLLSYDA